MKRSFKALKEVPNKSLTHTIDDFKIADKEDWKQIVINMKRLVSTENALKSLYEEEKLKLKSKYDKLDASDVMDFPKLDVESVKTHITLGNYQLSQAKSYIGEHLDKNGDYRIMIGKHTLDNIFYFFVLLLK